MSEVKQYQRKAPVFLGLAYDPQNVMQLARFVGRDLKISANYGSATVLTPLAKSNIALKPGDTILKNDQQLLVYSADEFDEVGA